MGKVVEAMSANVLVVHGGGPTAVINASLYGVVEEARNSGSIGKVYGAIGGSEGILKEQFQMCIRDRNRLLYSHSGPV